MKVKLNQEHNPTIIIPRVVEHIQTNQCPNQPNQSSLPTVSVSEKLVGSNINVGNESGGRK
jgi:hypothetical protein